MKTYINKVKRYGTITASVSVMLLSLSSCEDKYRVESPNFDLTDVQYSGVVGEPVTFRLGGNADLVTFYSGEEGNDYEFHNANRIYPGVLKCGAVIRFDHTGTFPDMEAAGKFDRCLDLMYSYDFSGSTINYNTSTVWYQDQAIKNATWHSVKDRFSDWPNKKTAASGVTLNPIDISDIFDDADGRFVYFGWKYVVEPVVSTSTAAGAGGSRRIVAYANYFTITFKAEEFDLPVPILEHVDIQWKQAYMPGYFDVTSNTGAVSLPDTVTRISTTSAGVTFNSLPISPKYAKEGWMISPPLKLSTTSDLGPEDRKSVV